ncbi:unnamed protein product [Paramecium octaurelia]|uniref:Protein kinase domain-containing protein n=1 Tax=Paramecium octaurelia TaxID=43137 RepID=A0A8S1XLY4_PAROT|nr:unnamed protein product [Paramecium octaurelia]
MITEERGNYIVRLDVILGEGSFGKAFTCFKKDDPSEEYCMKIIKKQSLNESDEDFKKKQLLAEMKVIKELKNTDSENLVKLIELIDLPQELCIVMELCDYDLYKEQRQLEANKKWFSRIEQMDIIRQILKGAKVLIENKFVHRDIKPQNILVKIINKGKINQRKIYKLADFGFTRVLDDIYKKADLTRVGTFVYCAPEIIRNHKFSAKCDIFSYGVVFHQIVYNGEFPDKYSNQYQMQEFLNKIEKQPYQCKQLQGEYSNMLKDLIEKMLLFNQDNRISFESLLDHEIVKMNLPMIKDSLFLTMDRKFDKEELEKQQVDNKQSKFDKIQLLIDIFYRKSLLCQSVITYMRENSLGLNIELSIVELLIQVIGLEEIRFAFAMLNLIVSDLESYIKNQHDIPRLMNILKKYLEDAKNNQVRQKLHEEVRTQFHRQLRKNQEDFNSLMIKKKSANINQLNSIMQFLEKSQYQKVSITQCCQLLEEFLSNNKVSQQVSKFEQKIQQYIEKIKKIETKFEICNYFFINPNDIFDIKTY